MQWKISHYRVALTEQETFNVSLYATDRHVADVVFVDPPERRFVLDPETRFVTIHLAAGERGGFLDILRHERGVTLDLEGPALLFER